MILDLFRRYVHGFVNLHDFEVPAQIMSDDYTLHTGADTLRGRDDPYLPAVAGQMEQFPGLSYTLHELVVEGDSLGVLFSEHGASMRAEGRSAAWPSIAIYRAADGRLVECWVEQDYYGRRAQLERGIPDPLLPVAVDAWDHHDRHEPMDEGRLEEWAASTTSWPPAGIALDPGFASAEQPRLSPATISVIRAVGERDAFVAILSVSGIYCGGLPGFDAGVGTSVTMRAGIHGRWDGDRVVGATGVSNRLAVQRQLKASR